MAQCGSDEERSRTCASAHGATVHAQCACIQLPLPLLHEDGAVHQPAGRNECVRAPASMDHRVYRGGIRRIFDEYSGDRHVGERVSRADQDLRHRPCHHHCARRREEEDTALRLGMGHSRRLNGKGNPAEGARRRSQFVGSSKATSGRLRPAFRTAEASSFTGGGDVGKRGKKHFRDRGVQALPGLREGAGGDIGAQPCTWSLPHHGVHRAARDVGSAYIPKHAQRTSKSAESPSAPAERCCRKRGSPWLR